MSVIETFTITLKYLGFTVAPNGDRFTLSRNGVDIERMLFTEGAAWSRASALAGLHDPFNSFMVKDALRAKDVWLLTVSFDLNSNEYHVDMDYGLVDDVDANDLSLTIAFCTAFNKLMENKDVKNNK